MKRIMERSLRRFLLIFLLILPNVLYAREHPGDGLLDYTIEASFDLQAFKIKGVVTIPVKMGQELNLARGKLKLLYVTLDKEPLEFSGQKEIVRILPSRQGVIEIGYEGTFEEPLSDSHGVEPSSVTRGYV
jgi:hypothetical protein